MTSSPTEAAATFQLHGPNRHSSLIFWEYADQIRHEEGIDVYELKAAMDADWPIVQRLLQKFRREQTFADESVLDEVWQEWLRAGGILTKEEQREKDTYNLTKARTAKDDLRGMSDAARFGTCKRAGCSNRKAECLLIRGFCPDCRGVTVKQTFAPGGCFNAAAPHLLDATNSELKTSVIVSKNRKKIHPDVLRLTSEERRARVTAARNGHPEASQQTIAALTGISQQQVSYILKNQSVKSNSEKDELKQFLRERAERQSILREDAKQYLKTRVVKSRYLAGTENADAKAILVPCAYTDTCPETENSYLESRTS